MLREVLRTVQAREAGLRRALEQLDQMLDRGRTSRAEVPSGDGADDRLRTLSDSSVPRLRMSRRLLRNDRQTESEESVIRRFPGGVGRDGSLTTLAELLLRAGPDVRGRFVGRSTQPDATGRRETLDRSLKQLEDSFRRVEDKVEQLLDRDERAVFS